MIKEKAWPIITLAALLLAGGLLLLAFLLPATASSQEADAEPTEQGDNSAVAASSLLGYELGQYGSYVLDSAASQQASSIVAQSASATAAVILSDAGVKASGDASMLDMSNGRLSICGAGTYCLSGSLSEGQILVNAENATVTLVLAGLDLSCSSDACILVQDAQQLNIVLEEGCNNSLNCSADFQDVEIAGTDAAIFSKSDVLICGDGSLDISCDAGAGIHGKDDLDIVSGAISIDAGDHGICGKDCLRIYGGSFDIIAAGDGLKSNNDSADKGYIYVSDGSFAIDAVQDGIQAESALLMAGGSFSIESSAGKGLSAGNLMILNPTLLDIDTADDSINCAGDVYFASSAGNCLLNTGDDAVHADQYLTVDGGKISIEQSYEGLEAYIITINDGVVDLTAQDDGFNASTGGNGGGWDFGGNMGGGNAQGGVQGDAQGGAQGDAQGGGEMPTGDMPSGQVDPGANQNMDGNTPGGNMPSGNMPTGQTGGGMSVQAASYSSVESSLSSGDQALIQTAALGSTGSSSKNSSTSGPAIIINGGIVRVNTPSGDGIDSNGYITINGGLLLISQTDNGNSPIDFETQCVVNGGIVMATGSSSMLESISSESAQASFSYGFSSNISAGTRVSITDSQGNLIASFVPEQSFAVLQFSAPGLQQGQSYSVYLGGTAAQADASGFAQSGTLEGATLQGQVSQDSVSVSAGGSSGMGGFNVGGNMGGGNMGGQGGNMGGGNMGGGQGGQGGQGGRR